MFGAVVGLGMAYYLFFHAAENWVTIAIQAVILATIFLSITVITGMAGEISLCVATFAAIGACTTAQLATRFGVAVMLAMVIGAIIAAAVGALLALPALRLGGIFLSLATFAFALFFDSVMVKFDWVGGGGLARARAAAEVRLDRLRQERSQLPPAVPRRAGDRLDRRDRGAGRHDRSGARRAARQRGRGDLDRHQRDAGASSCSPLSAAIAAVGGGMMAMNEKAANVNPNFVPFQSLVFVVLVVSLGSRTVEGAIQAAIGYAAFQIVILNQAFPWLVNNVQPWYHMGQPPQTLAIILLSIGAFTYAKHPEGILEFQKRRSLDRVQRTIDRFKGRGKIDGAVATSPPRADPPGHSRWHPRRRP